ncbi:hypothetical protein [Aquirufa sp. OSTEICH-129A]
MSKPIINVTAMRFEGSIVFQFEILNEKHDAERQRVESFRKFNAANERYFRFIESGLMRKRGYTLRGIEDVHLHRIKKI